MTEYNSSLFVIGKNIVYAVAGSLVVMLVASWFLSGAVAVVLGVAVALLIVYFAVYRDNIRVTVDGDTLSFWRFGTLLHEFPVAECGFKANIVTRRDMTGGDSDCTLRVVDAGGEETSIDCSMMGKTRFMRLLEDLGLVNAPAVPLATTKKRE